MKKKIGLTILVVVILVSIGLVMFFVDRYNNSIKGITAKNYKEVADVLTINENQKLIELLKEDLDNDSNLDYIGIIGEPKYKDKDESASVDELSKLTSPLEMYNNLEVVFINGSTKEIKKYNSEMSFDFNVNFEIKSDNNIKYIFVNDDSSGNVLLLHLQENELKDVIKDSISSDFNGYTITITFDSENTSKIKIKLDNYARSYLNQVNEEYTLEFENKEINKDNYRPTYLANKFCNFKLEDIDNDGILELIGIQNVLYLNITNDELPQIAGTINTIFKVNEGKITYNNVEVKL